jgi:hypothetical protein
VETGNEDFLDDEMEAAFCEALFHLGKFDLFGCWEAVKCEADFVIPKSHYG